MSSVALAFRNNIGLSVVLLLIGAGMLVFGLLALIMSRSGASLRPIAFIAGFYGLVLAPQLAYRLAEVAGWIPRVDLTWVPEGASASAVYYRANESLLSVRDGHFANRVGLFGEAHDPELVSDLVARMPGGPFTSATAAEMAIMRDASSMVVAHFADAASATRAGDQYAAMMFGTALPPGADGTITVSRSADVARLLVAGRTVVMWTSADVAALDRAFAASPLVERVAAPADAVPRDDGTAATAPNPRDFWLFRQYAIAPILLLLVLCVTFYFFRAAAWASESPARAGVAPVDAMTLRQRLLEVNALDAPFTVEADANDSSMLVVTWRYADAKWVDLARARGMRRTHRILMKLDERAGIVRPTEQVSSMDWSVGKGGADAQWMTMRGIIFFQQQSERVFGVQLDNRGRLTSNLSYKYDFNLQEMKAPLIAAVTNAGWRWRPTMLHGPAWLSWLTD